MKFTLRSLVTVTVLAVAFFMANSAMAATTINVLFPFTVNNQTCPAGHYLVVLDSSGDVVRLVGAKRSFVWSMHSGDPAPGDTRVVLRFDDQGSTHVLRAIQYGSLTTSRLDRKQLRRHGPAEVSLGR